MRIQPVAVLMLVVTFSFAISSCAFADEPLGIESQALFPNELEAMPEREPAATSKEKTAKKKSAKAPLKKKTSAKTASVAKPAAKLASEKKSTPLSDEGLLKAVDARYQNAKAIAMKVEKTLKIGLLAEERKSSGSLWISEGRIRMELEGVEKSVLVVNKNNLWAATYPGAEFPDAPVQVIRGKPSSKKGQQKNAMSLLSVGGFLTIFNSTGVKTLPSGQKAYTLAPKKGQTDFKKALVVLSTDGKAISEIKYWDARDNETQYLFRDVAFDTKEAFGKKIDNNLFDYTPPPGAEVMNL